MNNLAVYMLNKTFQGRINEKNVQIIAVTKKIQDWKKGLQITEVSCVFWHSNV